MAEGARLESVYTGNRIEGSNPSPSAISLLYDGLSDKWAAIDIDVNDIGRSRLKEKVNELGLSLIVCRSKSGGAELGCLAMKKIWQ